MKHFKPRPRKNDPYDSRLCSLFGVFNDQHVDFLELSTTYRHHILFSACALGLPLPCRTTVQFLKTTLHGNVATRLRCDEIFNDHVIVNLPLNEKVEQFWK